MEWFLNNYEWFFSGLGVFLISLVVMFLKKNKRSTKISKNIESIISKNSIKGKVEITGNENTTINGNDIS
ncbi:hypothetical protein [Pseudoalteromonas sp. OOF1S-7]|uniref:hypothetical protein n=1 Tax=Pseudoalteromonas sp. OOF1S-7 TaxID=2917757 RepID=UPI001EF619DA|nr:hypothetical protein [Pseudoalteromonas sp. OOF1S-7]